MNTKNTRIMLALLILFGAFVMFACDDPDDTYVMGQPVWKNGSPADKAWDAADKALDDAADAVSDFTKDAAGNALDTSFSNGNSLCDGLKCNGK